MDIEEYLRQKRSLEAKKELLEAKDRLQKQERRREPPASKETISRDDDAPKDQKPQRPERDDSFKREIPASTETLFRRLVMWNMIILVIVVGAAGAFLFLKDDSGATPSDSKNNPITGAAIANIASAQNTTPSPSQSPSPNQTTQPTKKQNYPGPDFKISLEDEELGPFEQPTGNIGGEHLVLNSPYYQDIILKIFNEDSSTMVCFIDRHVTVDENFDNNPELEDYNLDMFIEEVDKKSQEIIKDTAPGTFEQGEYNGIGKVTVEYEVRCYYCLDLLCDEHDPLGETKKSRLLKFSVNPPIIQNQSNTSA